LSKTNKYLVAGPRWVLYSKINWPTDGRNIRLTLRLHAVYPAVSQNYLTLNWLRYRVILAAKNEDVHKIMNQILAMLSGVVTEYKSIDNVLDIDEVVNFPPEFLN
jgi:hypothetical protein